MSKPVFRKTLPDGVTEQTGVRASSIVEAKGRLKMVSGDKWKTSMDGGESWSDDGDLGCAEMGSPSGLSCIRIDSGKLALAHRGKEDDRRGTEEWNWNPWYLSYSDDGGRTWTTAGNMNLLGGPYHDVLTQMSTGRLVMPSRICVSNNRHKGLEYDRVSTYGTWKGLRLQVSGHYHYPEVDIAAVSYSDDEGTTWTRCQGQLMGWFDADGVPNGKGGITAVDEPSVAECSDGRLMMMGRSTVGRLVNCYSEDGGENWTPVLPMDLAASYSPPRLRRIPSTGDLLCIWNQTSREEILHGYRRGRLSSAVSRDNGESWEHFRTLEVSGGMEDVDRIAPDLPVSPIVALPDVGALPEDFCKFDYPNVWFYEDRVFVQYNRSWVAEGEGWAATTLGEKDRTAKKPGEAVFRIYPLDWFYGDGSGG